VQPEHRQPQLDFEALNQLCSYLNTTDAPKAAELATRMLTDHPIKILADPFRRATRAL
jgi:hypothetical protein